MSMKNIEKATMGYVSPEDFFSTIFGLKYIVINSWFAFFCALTTFITNYIWDDAKAIYTLGFLMLVDGFTGVFLSLRAAFILERTDLSKYNESELAYFKRRRFRSTRLPRIFIAIVIAATLLAISHWLSKFHILYYYLPSIIYGGLTSTYLVSLIENCAEYGLLSKDFITLLKEKLNPTNWIKK